MRCPHWDAGWCYADKEEDTDAIQGACKGQVNCNAYNNLLETKHDSNSVRPTRVLHSVLSTELGSNR